jgi:hypothetical protein
MGITGNKKMHIIYRIEPITPEEVLAPSIPGSRFQLAGKMPGGATDAMVPPDASYDIDCHGQDRCCDRREAYDSVPVYIQHNMRAEASVKITCLCFPKPQINADARRFDSTWRRKQLS